jgi:hypothetical protein
MVYLLSTMHKGVGSCELTLKFGVHQKTAWFFKRKFQRALNGFPRAKLNENVENDETLIGGFKSGKTGRSKGIKQLVQLCIEVEHPTYGKRRGKINIVDARVLKDATSNSIKEALQACFPGWHSCKFAPIYGMLCLIPFSRPTVLKSFKR